METNKDVEFPAAPPNIEGATLVHPLAGPGPINLATLPRRMKGLPVDRRGYPVPWFVLWVNGEPEFRAIDTAKWKSAVRDRRCWVCGGSLSRWLAFPIGPMCAITRTTSEPPTHRECAEWSIRHCPFLSNPRMVRREGALPPGLHAPAGQPLTRNPGVVCLWMTRSFELFADHQGQPLITVGPPEDVTWWAEGRAATLAEVQTSLDDGLPALLAAAKRDGPFAVERLGKELARLGGLLPGA